MIWQSQPSGRRRGQVSVKSITFVAPSGAGGAFDVALRSSQSPGDNKIVDQQMLVEPARRGGSVFLTEYVVKDSKNDYKLF